MRSFATVQAVVDALKARVDLQHRAGDFSEQTVEFDPSALNIALIGFLSPARAHAVIVIGSDEIDYLDSLSDTEQHQFFQLAFDDRTRLLIVSNGLHPPDSLIQLSNEQDLALFTSQRASQELFREIEYSFDHTLAQPLVMHGVFLDVMGLGVMITGDSGVGKSELALELISRGHRLIADDAPEFRRTEPHSVTGTAPPTLQDFLEVRGLGILNVLRLYGDSSVKHRQNLRLIVHLNIVTDTNKQPINRLHGDHQIADVIGVSVPKVILPVAPGRNLSVLLEAAVRNQLLINQGYSSVDDFINRQSAAIDSNP